MDVSQKNRQINLLEIGDLILHRDKKLGPVVYEFLEFQSYTRGKPYHFLVRDIFLRTGSGTRCFTRPCMQSSSIEFIDYDSKQYKAIKVLYGSVK